MAKAEKATAFEIKGINQLLRVLSKLPKDLQNEVRDASTEIAGDLVSGAKAAASTPMERMVVGGLKVKRDRVPVVATGGTLRPGVKTRDVFYGAEFGGRARSTTQQFLPHLRQQGRFLYPTARKQARQQATRWAEAIDKAFKDWNYRAPEGNG